MLDVRADKQWLTAAEAASERLPDFPSTKRHVNRVITEANIATRKRVGRGGGREFHWSELPAEARAEYLKRYPCATASLLERGDTRARAAARDVQAEARARIVERAAQFAAERSLTNGKALKAFATAYGARRAGLEPWIYESIAQLAPHLIRAWQKKLSQGGSAALVDGRGRPQGSWIDDDADLRAFIVARFAERSLSAVAIRNIVAAEKNRDVPLRTLQAFLATLRQNNPALVKALSDPDRARSHHKPAFGSLSMNLTRPNELWEIDASPADVMCATPEGPRRYKITAVLDVKTRRARVVVSDQPRALATQALLRRSIIELGVPETLKADNGKEYKNRAVERFCRDTGIAIEWSRPFTPEQKGHIERFFKTLFHSGFFESLPGFLGHNVAERKGIENRRSFAHRFGEEALLVADTKLSPAELQGRLDLWLRDVYEHTPHGGLPASSSTSGGQQKYMTPAAKALAHAGEARFLENPRALDVLLFDVPDNHGIRIVGKRGVRVGNVFYIAAELGEFMGQRVHVKLDPLDPATAIIYRVERDEFLCVARDADSLDGESRMRVALGAQAAQRQLFSRVRADVRKVQRQHPSDGVADRILQLAAYRNGAVAQRIEQQPSKLSAEGSNPSGAANAFEAPAEEEHGRATGPVNELPRQLSPESERAMIDANRPMLHEHARALEAIEQSKSVPQPIPVTDEERAGALAFLEAATPHLPAPRLVECDGYTRPFFENNVDFYYWAETAEQLDAEDRRFLAELRDSETFKLMLDNERARRAGAAA